MTYTIGKLTERGHVEYLAGCAFHEEDDARARAMHELTTDPGATFLILKGSAQIVARVSNTPPAPTPEHDPA